MTGNILLGIFLAFATHHDDKINSSVLDMNLVIIHLVVPLFSINIAWGSKNVNGESENLFGVDGIGMMG